MDFIPFRLPYNHSVLFKDKPYVSAQRKDMLYQDKW